MFGVDNNDGFLNFNAEKTIPYIKKTLPKNQDNNIKKV